MSKIAEMRQKRGDLWDKAKAFLNEHADANGMMSAEDTATYERMEKEIDNFGIAIDRQERAERLEREMNAPTSDILSSRPEKPVPDKQGRASDEYRDAFWKMVRDRSAHYTVFNALQIGTDSEGGYLCPDEYERTLVQALEDDGFTMIPFGQGFRDMSPPTKELMRIVLEHRLNHGGHPVLRWNFDNAYVRTDPAGNLKLDKEKSTEKIDGAVALVMALDRAMKNQSSGDSVYDDRGLLLL